MSTILKALEKSQSQQAMPPTVPVASSGWKVMMVSVLLLIAILLGVVIFLLLRPAPQVTKEPVLAIKTQLAPVVEVQQQEVIDTLPIAEPVSRVSEVQFKTIPLPIRQAPAPSWDSVDPVAVTSEQASDLPEQIAETGVTAQDKLDAINEKQQQEELLSDIDLDSVPESLKQRFALAVEEEKNGVLSDKSIQAQPQQVVASDIREMPSSFQRKVPNMRYDSHVYSTNEADSWIRINGVDMRIGDVLGDIELVDILAQQSVFRLGGQSFTLESLQDWNG
ncbi:general secretion pathway protein GspB [Psychromonas sp. KJ10-2]|uniref:general secretion pathway protein GspB n=1 Tax=Psychromonas sp. KJ10-2 TaxID=3391822 RepID=UPI0039B64CD9